MSCDVGSKEFKEYADMANIPNSYRVWAYQMWMNAQRQVYMNTNDYATALKAYLEYKKIENPEVSYIEWLVYKGVK